MWLLRLDAAGAQQDGADLGCGAKAESLRGLLAAGLPVPPGFVVTHAAFRAAVGEAALRVDVDALGQALEQLASVIEAAELPAELEELVTRQAAELAGAAGSGGPLAVRSSISLEDRAAGAAAGVFSSKVAVTPSEVWPAIRAVWASVCTPLAAAYAQQSASALVTACSATRSRELGRRVSGRVGASRSVNHGLSCCRSLFLRTCSNSSVASTGLPSTTARHTCTCRYQPLMSWVSSSSSSEARTMR
jgi:hypothetical protein